MSIVLCWIFDEIGDVFIMGYKFLDMDVLGFVFGVSCFVCFNQKKVYIVINENEIILDVECCFEEIYKYLELEM